MLSQQPPEFLLQLLQRFIKHSHQIKQIHSLLITNGHLLLNSNSSSTFKRTNTLLYNTLLRAYLNLAQPHTTLLLFTHMLAHQAPPNDHTFPSLFKAATSSPSFACLLGKPLHAQALKRGVSNEPFVHTSLLGLYAQLGNLSAARTLFEETSEPCVPSFNAMLDALGKNGDVASAVLLFERMPQRDVVSWTSMISGYGTNGMFREAIQFFAQMMVHVLN